MKGHIESIRKENNWGNLQYACNVITEDSYNIYRFKTKKELKKFLKDCLNNDYSIEVCQEVKKLFNL